MNKLEKLRQARKELEDKIKTAAKSFQDAAETEEAGEEAEKAFTDAEKALDDLVAEREDLDAKIDKQLKAIEKAADSAKPREIPEGSMGKEVPVSPADYSDEQRKERSLGIMVSGLYAKHAGMQVDDAFVRLYGEKKHAQLIGKGQQLSDYSTGGALSAPDFAEQIIEGLDNMTVVRGIAPPAIPLVGALTMPREVTAPDGAWTGENAAPTPGEFTFGDVRLDPKRLPIETVVSRRLLDQAARGQSAVRNLEAYLVRRLRERRAVQEDAGFLRGSGTEYVPLGIRRQANSDHINAISGTTAANKESDLRSCVTQLQEANIIITRGYWVMAPRTRANLADLRDSNGNKIYPSIDENNALLGYEIKMTNQIPVNLGGGANESEIVFVNGDSIMIGDDANAVVTTSVEGSYQSGATHYSLVQRYEMLIHLEGASDVKLERDTAISVLTGVTY